MYLVGLGLGWILAGGGLDRGTGNAGWDALDLWDLVAGGLCFVSGAGGCLCATMERSRRKEKNMDKGFFEVGMCKQKAGITG